MKIQEYLAAIADAETAKSLFELGAQAKTDGELFAVQRREVGDAISARFCALNCAAAKPVSKGRWD